MKLIPKSKPGRIVGGIAAGVIIAAFAGCGSSATVVTGESPPGVSRDVAASWPAKWCQTRYGMTRAEVRAVMGAPTTEHIGAEAQQDEWHGYQYAFTAFYTNRVQVTDPLEQTVTQLAANPTGLSPADRAAIPCALTRGAPGEKYS